MKKPDPIEMLETVESVKKEADELMMKKIEHYEKELALVREQAQIDIMTLEKRIEEIGKINMAHKKLNGELREDNKAFEISNKAYGKLLKDASDKNIRLAKQINEALEKLSKYEDQAAHYRRKGVL